MRLDKIFAIHDKILETTLCHFHSRKRPLDWVGGKIRLQTVYFDCKIPNKFGCLMQFVGIGYQHTYVSSLKNFKKFSLANQILLAEFVCTKLIVDQLH